MDNIIKIKNVGQPAQFLNFYVEKRDGSQFPVGLGQGAFIFVHEQETRNIKVYARKELLSVEVVGLPSGAELYKIYSEDNFEQKVQHVTPEPTIQLEPQQETQAVIDTPINVYDTSVPEEPKNDQEIDVDVYIDEISIAEEPIDQQEIQISQAETQAEENELKKIERAVEQYQKEKKKKNSHKKKVGRPKKRGPKPKKKPVGRPKKK